MVASGATGAASSLTGSGSGFGSSKATFFFLSWEVFLGFFSSFSPFFFFGLIISFFFGGSTGSGVGSIAAAGTGAIVSFSV